MKAPTPREIKMFALATQGASLANEANDMHANQDKAFGAFWDAAKHIIHALAETGFEESVGFQYFVSAFSGPSNEHDAERLLEDIRHYVHVEGEYELNKEA